MQFFLQAIGIGFLLSVMVGPVFFILLETSITKGIRAALALDIGVFISDILYILFALSFVDQISSINSGENKLIFGFIGGSIFIIYGTFYFFKKSKMVDLTLEAENTSKEVAAAPKDYLLLGLKGFILNIANPAVIFYWLSILSLAAQSVPDNTKNPNTWILLFLSILLGTYFGIDVLKVFTAKRLRTLVNQNLLNALNILIGLIFFLTGIFQIIKNFQIILSN
ncbi:MAG: LysE family transporter [Flavobacteriia bacterium]|jgi:threonine/homoserine/homoserine lactone efflux protein|nr:LysE family transporter [Flavobacteriia bacterium]